MNAFNEVQAVRQANDPIQKERILIWKQTGDIETFPAAGAAK